MGLNELRIVLNQEDFSNLVRGQEIVKPGARIILSDIGFAVMWARLADAAGIRPVCSHIVSSGDGTNYCALAEQTAGQLSALIAELDKLRSQVGSQ